MQFPSFIALRGRNAVCEHYGSRHGSLNFAVSAPKTRIVRLFLRIPFAVQIGCLGCALRFLIVCRRDSIFNSIKNASQAAAWFARRGLLCKHSYLFSGCAREIHRTNGRSRKHVLCRSAQLRARNPRENILLIGWKFRASRSDSGWTRFGCVFAFQDFEKWILGFLSARLSISMLCNNDQISENFCVRR